MRRHAAAAAALLLAAALVTWIRLLPLSLPALPDLARARARQWVATHLAAPPAAAPAEARRRAVDDWIAAHPDDFARAVADETTRLDEAFHYRDRRGRRWVHLGDLDSYAWLRAAANRLRHGVPCDALVDGQCRDELTMAPLGLSVPYARSLHVAAIAALQRLATGLDPDFPLPASAYLVAVLAGVLGVLPAFAIGSRLGGALGGFTAALVSGVHPVLLRRSIGSDNDVWNVVLPLYAAWALIAALQAPRRRGRIGGAAAGGGVAGLHAATWTGWSFAFVALLGGLLAALALHAAHWGLRRRSARVWAAPRVRAVALVTLIFALVAGGTAEVVGTEETALGALRRTLVTVAPDPPDPADEPMLPSAFAMVSELAVPGLGVIAAQSYGHLLFFTGWLGMLLLLLPRSRWRSEHFLVLIAGTLLYRYLLTTTAVPPRVLVGVLALPLAAAAAIAARDGDDQDLETASAGALIAVWLLAALLVSFSAVRFILLLAPPLGIATGVAAGRLHGWLAAEARAWLGDGPLPRLLATGAVLALAVLPLRVAHATAAYLPAIDGAWVGVLERVRAATPPDAVVSVWWDYGYWTKFVAARRVNADGGSLRTPVPHWLARAQLADSEVEALGILRMLDCASDARPYPEGEQGAMARLMRHGLDERAAYEAIGAIAGRGRGAADAHLASLGLEPAARADVLAATHCAPPPAVLVLTSDQIDFGGWWRIGRWRPGRGDDGQAVGLVTRDWVECALAGGERRCPVGAPDGRGAEVDAVVFADGAPRGARVVVRRDGATSAVAPSRLLLAGGMAVETIAGADASAPAVLLDGQQRALVGRPEAIASLYVRLMYLDGRGLDHFRKLDERAGARNQRVAAWEISW